MKFSLEGLLIEFLKAKVQEEALKDIQVGESHEIKGVARGIRLFGMRFKANLTLIREK